MRYDKEFEEIVNTTVIDSRWTMEDRLWFVWQAARKDHYRIGEEIWVKVLSPYHDDPENYGEVHGEVCVSTPIKLYTDVDIVSVRRIPAKSRIDEIAEEAEDKYRRGAVGAGSLTDIIKSAILQARKEWEANQ